MAYAERARGRGGNHANPQVAHSDLWGREHGPQNEALTPSVKYRPIVSYMLLAVWKPMRASRMSRFERSSDPVIIEA